MSATLKVQCVFRGKVARARATLKKRELTPTKSAIEILKSKNFGELSTGLTAVISNHEENTSSTECGDWVEQYDPASACVYYYNCKTGGTQWEKPKDFKAGGTSEKCTAALKLQNLFRGNHARNLAQEKLEEMERKNNLWVKEYDPQTRQYYYYNVEDYSTTWDQPADFCAGGVDERMASVLLIQCAYRTKKSREEIKLLKSSNFGELNRALSTEKGLILKSKSFGILNPPLENIKKQEDVHDIAVSKKVSGKITLKIKCLKGKELHKVASFGFSQDPYLRFIVVNRSGSEGGEKCHSEVSSMPHQKGNTEPDWQGEELSLQLIRPDKESVGRFVLVLECYDYEEKNDDRFIGYGELPLDTFLQAELRDRVVERRKETVQLFQRAKTKNKEQKPAGYVDIEIWAESTSEDKQEAKEVEDTSIGGDNNSRKKDTSSAPGKSENKEKKNIEITQAVAAKAGLTQQSRKGNVIVSVTVLKGNDLKNVESFFRGKQDPFLKFKLGGIEAQTEPHMDGGQVPDWKGQVCKLEIPVYPDGTEPGMLVECWDFEKSKKHKLIGAVTIKLPKRASRQEFENPTWYELMDAKGNSKCGQVELGICLVENNASESSKQSEAVVPPNEELNACAMSNREIASGNKTHSVVGWIEQWDPNTQHPFFYNVESGEWQWEKPNGFISGQQPETDNAIEVAKIRALFSGHQMRDDMQTKFEVYLQKKNRWIDSKVDDPFFVSWWLTFVLNFSLHFSLY
jgi:hypothetical protein